MLVPQLLLETLEDLSGADYEKFKWFLGQKVLEGCEKIPKCDLETPHRHYTVSKMVETYGEEMAVNMTVAILRLMKHNNAAEQLQKTLREGAAAQEKVSRPPVTSSSASGLPTGRKISDGAAGAELRDHLRAAPAPRANTRGIVMGSPGGNLGDDICGMVQGLLDMNVGGNVFTANSGRNVGGDNDDFVMVNSRGVGGGDHGFDTGNPGGNVGGDDVRSIVTRLLDGDAGRKFGRNVLPGGVNGNLQSNFRGIVKGDVSGNVGENVRGLIRGSVRGNLGNNFRGVVEGDVCGSVGSNFRGVITGDVKGCIGSNFRGILMGNVYGVVGSNFRVAKGNVADYIHEIVTSW